MNNDDEGALRTGLLALRDGLSLQHDDSASARAIVERASRGRRPWYRRPRWIVPTVCVAAGIGIGVPVAVAVVSGNDGSRAAFRHLHPNKANAHLDTEQPHALVATIRSDGHLARAYVTLPVSRKNCALVENLTPAGQQIDGISYCGLDPAHAADIRDVNGALLGWVPDTRITSVRVETTGHGPEHTSVVAQHFLLPLPGHTPTGTTFRVTGFDAAGHVVGHWSVAD